MSQVTSLSSQIASQSHQIASVSEALTDLHEPTTDLHEPQSNLPETSNDLHKTLNDLPKPPAHIGPEKELTFAFVIFMHHLHIAVKLKYIIISVFFNEISNSNDVD